MLSPQLPDYGCFPRWPENGQGFIHPDDVPLVTRCIPSERVFKREVFDGTYYHFRYGRSRLRLRPCMWLKVSYEGIDIGDKVETIGVGMERELFVGQVWGMHYVRRKGRILYRIRRGETRVPRLFAAEQLRLLTDKSKIREGTMRHPEPRWTGKADTIGGLDL